MTARGGFVHGGRNTGRHSLLPAARGRSFRKRICLDG